MLVAYGKVAGASQEALDGKVETKSPTNSTASGSTSAATATRRPYEGLGNKGLLCLWDIALPRTPLK
jgi:hypothetical protein